MNGHSRRAGRTLLALALVAVYGCGSSSPSVPNPQPTPVVPKASVYVLEEPVDGLPRARALVRFESSPTEELLSGVEAFRVLDVTELVVDPRGRFLYLAGYDSRRSGAEAEGFVHVYARDGKTGGLTPTATELYRYEAVFDFLAGSGFVMAYVGTTYNQHNSYRWVRYRVTDTGTLEQARVVGKTPYLPEELRSCDSSRMVVSTDGVSPLEYDLVAASDCVGADVSWLLTWQLTPSGFVSLGDWHALEWGPLDFSNGASVGGVGPFVVIADGVGQLLAVSVDPATGKPTVQSALKTECGVPAIVSGPASRFALVCDGGARLFTVDTSGALTPYEEIPGFRRWWHDRRQGHDQAVAFDPSERFIYSLGTSVTNPGPVGVRTHEILADGRLREVAFAALLDSIKPGAIVVAPLDAE